MSKRRVLIVGLDGGTWDVLEPMMTAGVMPHLQRLVRGGTKGLLESTLPPITPVAWSTFHTGCNPGRHGVFDFSRTLDRGRQWEIVNSTSLGVKTLWNVLSENGRRVGLVNVPMTFPPTPVNGVMVTGLFTPGLDVDFTYPASLKEQLLEAVPGYDIIRARGKGSSAVYVNDIRGFVEEMIKLIENRTRAAVYLMNWLNNWDMFMVHFQAVDKLQHLLWPFLDETCSAFNLDDFREVKRFYAAVDHALAQLHAVLREEDWLVVVSDHGFQRHDKTVLINNWLHREGFLFKTTIKSQRLFSLAFNAARAVDVFQLRRRLVEKGLRNQVTTLVKSELGIDWTRTRAVGIARNSHALIYAQGTPLEREATISDLKNRLARFTDPSNGSRIVDDILEGNQIYMPVHGNKKPSEFPDLLIKPKSFYAFRSSWDFTPSPMITEPKIGSEYHLGIHHSEGVLLLHGRDIKADHTVRSKLVHVTPTLVHAAGLPIPSYMDGEVIEDAFEPQFAELNPVAHCADGGSPDTERDYSFDDHERAVIENRLKDLGYL
jgi:predicted AlkP superfamily phosphohydrolase/phosphomutase